MATPARRCLICGKSLAGKSPKALTCSPAHQKALSRRRQRETEAQRASAGRGADSFDEVVSLVNTKTQDAIRAAFVEELRPVIREAIDQDAVRAIQGMVGLAPAAILVLEQDLRSDDPILRSKAAALVVKYTMGNPMVTPPRGDTGDKLVIINQLPDGHHPAIDATTEDVQPAQIEGAETKRCSACRLPKPLDQFDGDGPMCDQCMAERREAILGSFLSPDERSALDSEHAVPEPGTASDVQRPSPPGQPEVHQAGAGLQPSDLRAARPLPEGQAPLAGFESLGPPLRPAPVRSASETFPGPPDPMRWSTGR